MTTGALSRLIVIVSDMAGDELALVRERKREKRRKEEDDAAAEIK
jgi:hypothetical protein